MGPSPGSKATFENTSAARRHSSPQRFVDLHAGIGYTQKSDLTATVGTESKETSVNLVLRGKEGWDIRYSM